MWAPFLPVRHFNEEDTKPSNTTESQLDSLRLNQHLIEDEQRKIHDIRTNFYPMVAYVVCAFSRAVDSTPLYQMARRKDTHLDREIIDSIVNQLHALLHSEEMRNKVEGVETFDIDQFVAEFTELCICKDAEEPHLKRLAKLKAREAEIKESLGIK